MLPVMKLLTTILSYASKHHDYKTRSITAHNFYLERAKSQNGQRFCSDIGVKIILPTSKILPTLKKTTKILF